MLCNHRDVLLQDVYCMVTQSCPSQSPLLPHEDMVLCAALGSGLSLRLRAGLVLVQGHPEGSGTLPTKRLT